MAIDLHVIANQAEAIVRDAGQLLREHYSHPIHETSKGHKFDIVTKTDKASEALIVNALTHAFPTHHIVGEEGGGAGAAKAEAEYRWYIDPVDGTINFANHIPIFAVTIAMTDRDMQPLIGLIYNPVTEQMYKAVRGFGAALNGEALRVSARDSLDVALAGSDFASDRSDPETNNLAEWRAVTTVARDVLCFGSAALDLALVAEGKLDVYWQGQLKPWDLLAGVLLIMEAGGTVTDYGGDSSPEKIANGQVLATNGILHQPMLEILRQVRSKNVNE